MTDYQQQLQNLSVDFQLPACCKLLHITTELFNGETDLTKSTVAERFLIGGIDDIQTHKTYAFNKQLLGGLDGYASFKKILKSDPQGFADLMKVLPSVGPVDAWHYLQFIDNYKSWFLNNGYKQCRLYPATRLLSMKRPDIFVPLTEETMTVLCTSLSIKPLKNQDFMGYWDKIVQTIHKMKWFIQAPTEITSELTLDRVRVALLERLLIDPPPIEEFVIEQESELNTSDNEVEITSLIKEATSAVVRKPVKQPKKMTIAKRQTVKGNRNAATKLMSQYYFANKQTYSKIDIKKYREKIIEQLIEGGSVEEIFAKLL